LTKQGRGGGVNSGRSRALELVLSAISIWLKFPLQILGSANTLLGMSDVTQILSQIQFGDPSAAAELLPLVYDELRELAALRMAQERPDHSLDATALVHQAYLRLIGDQQFDGRRRRIAGFDLWQDSGDFGHQWRNADGTHTTRSRRKPLQIMVSFMAANQAANPFNEKSKCTIFSYDH
jgi:hypothetical protein